MATLPLIETKVPFGTSIFDDAIARGAMKIEMLNDPAIPPDYAFNLMNELSIYYQERLNNNVIGNVMIGGDGITKVSASIVRLPPCTILRGRYGIATLLNTDFNAPFTINSTYTMYWEYTETRTTSGTDPLPAPSPLTFQPASGAPFDTYNDYRVTQSISVGIAPTLGLVSDTGLVKIYRVSIGTFTTDGTGNVNVVTKTLWKSIGDYGVMLSEDPSSLVAMKHHDNKFTKTQHFTINPSPVTIVGTSLQINNGEDGNNVLLTVGTHDNIDNISFSPTYSNVQVGSEYKIGVSGTASIRLIPSTLLSMSDDQPITLKTGDTVLATCTKLTPLKFYVAPYQSHDAWMRRDSSLILNVSGVGLLDLSSSRANIINVDSSGNTLKNIASINIGKSIVLAAVGSDLRIDGTGNIDLSGIVGINNAITGGRSIELRADVDTITLSQRGLNDWQVINVSSPKDINGSVGIYNDSNQQSLALVNIPGGTNPLALAMVAADFDKIRNTSTYNLPDNILPSNNVNVGLPFVKYIKTDYLEGISNYNITTDAFIPTGGGIVAFDKKNITDFPAARNNDLGYHNPATYTFTPTRPGIYEISAQVFLFLNNNVNLQGQYLSLYAQRTTGATHRLDHIGGVDIQVTWTGIYLGVHMCLKGKTTMYLDGTTGVKIGVAHLFAATYVQVVRGISGVSDTETYFEAKWLGE